MPIKKVKTLKNPITGATRTITKFDDGEKRMETSSGKKKLKIKRKNNRMSNKPFKGKMEGYKKGGKIRSMFTEQYD